MKHGLLVLLALTVLVGCEPTKPTSQTSDGMTLSESQRLNQWLDGEFETYLDFSPMSKTRLGDKSDYDKLDDPSDAAADARLAWRRVSVASLKAEFDRDALEPEAQRSYDLWVFMLDRAEASLPYRRHEYVFGRNGPHTGLPNDLINYHKVDSASDMQAYIARLKASAGYFDAYLNRAKLAAAAGIRAPYFDYDVAVSQIQRVTRGAPFTDEGTSALWADITAKVDALVLAESITVVEAEALKAEAKTAILQSMEPAYDRINAWLEADRDSVPDTATGAWALPEGAAFYTYRLKQMTTLPLTAEAIHQTGLDEVTRIQAEMNAIRKSVGFEGSLQDFFTHLRTSDEFYFENTDEGRERYLQLARDFISGIEAKLPDYFGILPKGPLEVRRVEAFREQAGGAAHYMRGTKDGSRPGVFYAHLADMQAMSIFRLENLAYHEGLPGHHLQIAIQQELEGLPRFRTYHGYTAFSEGWGLYSEWLGKEMGFYQDSYRDFGRLTGEIWRAIRLVVDTGIHAKGWTEAEAIDYALTNSPRPAPTVKSEIRRYFNMPGQATAYKVGMLEIQRIRGKAEAALKDRFDIRDFHDQILGSGPLPMPVLEQKIDEWIAASL
ncbi:DUF885 domain-containing protein [Pseudomonadales bacterium]|nr:DUF885 domain-containing protein [Pseudomonadales bacterium]